MGGGGACAVLGGLHGEWWAMCTTSIRLVTNRLMVEAPRTAQAPPHRVHTAPVPTVGVNEISIIREWLMPSVEQ